MVRCAARTQHRSQCQRQALPGRKLCPQHAKRRGSKPACKRTRGGHADDAWDDLVSDASTEIWSEAALRDELEAMRERCAKAERILETTKRRLATQNDARQQYIALALSYQDQAQATEDLVRAHQDLVLRYRDAFLQCSHALSDEDSSRFHAQFKDGRRAISETNKKLRVVKSEVQDKLDYIHVAYPSVNRERKAVESMLLLGRQ